MKCLINDVIKSCVSRKIRAEVIHRYLKIKHRVNIDTKSVSGRIKAIQMDYNFR